MAFNVGIAIYCMGLAGTFVAWFAMMVRCRLLLT